MPSIYLIRHGQASFGKENYDQLSELGESQAYALGESISNRIDKFDQVYLGTMLRHEQTAANCLSHYQSDCANVKKTLADCGAVYDAGWNEYDHEEILLRLSPELTSVKEISALMAEQDEPKKAFRNYFSDAVARWMTGNYDADYSESWHDFTQRVQTALQRVISANADSDGISKGKNIVVFTSGGPISVVSQSLLGVPKEKMMEMNWTLLNCGVTKLVVTSSHTFLSSLNEHTHFEGKQNKHFITYT